MSRPTFDQLFDQIPDWCGIGKLVYVDPDFLFLLDIDSKSCSTVGLILSSYVIGVENLDEEEYNEIMQDEEWLIHDVLVDGHYVRDVYNYSLSKFIGEENAKEIN